MLKLKHVSLKKKELAMDFVILVLCPPSAVIVVRLMRLALGIV